MLEMIELHADEDFNETLSRNVFVDFLHAHLDQFRDPKEQIQATPQVSGVNPAQPESSLVRQPFSLNGSGFISGTEAMLEEAFRARQHGFTESELKRAKKEQMRFIEQAYNEKDKTESIRFAQEYARNFYEHEAAPGIEAELELFKKWIPEITLDDVNSLVKKVITKNNMVITVSAPEKEGIEIPTEEEIMAVYDKVSQKKLERKNR